MPRGISAYVQTITSNLVSLFVIIIGIFIVAETESDISNELLYIKNERQPEQNIPFNKNGKIDIHDSTLDLLPMCVKNYSQNLNITTPIPIPKNRFNMNPYSTA